MIYNYLFDWQKRIVDKYKERETFALYLDMGLGKSPIALSFAEQNGSSKILIISINKKALEKEDEEGSFFYWAKKMDKSFNLYNKTYNFRNEGVIKRRVNISPETKDILLINYEGLYKPGQSEIINGKKHKKCVLSDIIDDFIKSCRNQKVTIIVDESHKVKELDSLPTKALNKIKRNLQINGNKVYTYLLSGTPFTTGYIDLYSQLKILGWEGNKKLYEDSFCIKGDIWGLLGWQQPIIGYKNVDKLYNLIHQYGLTIKSEEVIELPEKIFVNHRLNNTLEMNLISFEKYNKKEIEQYVKERDITLPYKLDDGKTINNPFYRNIMFPSQKWEAETVSIFWMRARQMSIGFQGNEEEYVFLNRSRLNKLKDLLEDNPDNYVLFYNFMPEFFELFQICETLGYNIDVYNGEFKSLHFYEKYSKQTEAERLTNKKNIILANFKSGATGGNWQLYNKCIIFSIPLFDDYNQGIKRIHRIGQKETTIYHIFYSDNWLDKSMIESLNTRKDYDEELFKADLKRIQELISI